MGAVSFTRQRDARTRPVTFNNNAAHLDRASHPGLERDSFAIVKAALAILTVNRIDRLDKRQLERAPVIRLHSACVSKRCVHRAGRIIDSSPANDWEPQNPRA